MSATDATMTSTTRALPDTEQASGHLATLRIEAGVPTPEEVAALVVVLSALGGGEGEPVHARSPWSDPRWQLVGPSARRDGWRTSALPR